MLTKHSLSFTPPAPAADRLPPPSPRTSPAPGIVTDPRPKRGRPLKSHVPTRRVLAEIPTRALLFLTGVSRTPALRVVLEKAGYTREAHVAGMRLLAATCDYRDVARLATRREPQHARLALYRWFTRWSMTAHAVVKRKDWLITLGLAGRAPVVRRAGADEDE